MFFRTLKSTQRFVQSRPATLAPVILIALLATTHNLSKDREYFPLPDTPDRQMEALKGKWLQWKTHGDELSLGLENGQGSVVGCNGS